METVDSMYGPAIHENQYYFVVVGKDVTEGKRTLYQLINKATHVVEEEGSVLPMMLVHAEQLASELENETWREHLAPTRVPEQLLQ